MKKQRFTIVIFILFLLGFWDCFCTSVSAVNASDKTPIKEPSDSRSRDINIPSEESKKVSDEQAN